MSDFLRRLVLEWGDRLAANNENPSAADVGEELRLRLRVIQAARLEAATPGKVGYVYLGGPYTHDRAEVQTYRADMITSVAAQLWAANIPTMSAVTHGHTIATRLPVLGADRYYGKWLQFSYRMLESAAAFAVLTLPGWKESEGVAKEETKARDLALPIVYLDPSKGMEQHFPELRQCTLPSFPKPKTP